LLLAREAGIPDAADASDRWSVDHLFVDSEGVPIFVEIKRKSDTRVRREVVAQMLDYTSHATMYWRAADLRKKFEETLDGQSPEEALNEFLPRPCGRIRPSLS
jgi:hypothetical protein